MTPHDLRTFAWYSGNLTWLRDRTIFLTKHGSQAYGTSTPESHLVRLLRMAGEILRGDGVIVRRPDAEELLDIRRGAWSFDRLEAWAKEQEAALETIDSPLPNEPDRKTLDRILVDVISSAL